MTEPARTLDPWRTRGDEPHEPAESGVAIDEEGGPSLDFAGPDGDRREPISELLDGPYGSSVR